MGKGGGGGSVQVPRLFTPSGLYQGLSNVESLAQGAQSLFGPLASAAGWAQGLATGFQTQQPSANFLPGGKFAVQQGPTVTLTNGYTGNQAEQWTSSFDPTTDLITITNEVTGERLYDYAGNQLQYQQQGTQNQHISFGSLPYAQWEQLRQQYVNSPQGQGSVEGVPGQGTAGTGLSPGKSAGQAFVSQLGQALQPAWEQIQAIPRLEAKAGKFTNQQIQQEQQFLGQGNQLFNQGQTMETQGAPMIAAGEQTWNTGANIIGQGQQVINEGQPLIGLGENIISQGVPLIGLGEGVIQEGQPFIDAAGNIIGQGEGIVGAGENLLNFATGGTGLFPSQEAFVQQQTQAEQNQLSQQLAAEGLGSSTANAILRGEAAQQGAATAGQLIQGNINAADQTISAGNQTMQTGVGVGGLGTNIMQTGTGIIGAGNQTIGQGTGVIGAGNQVMQTGAGIINAGSGVIGQGTGQVEAGQQQIELGQNQISLAQQQYNLAQGSAKLALGGQELQLGEETAMAQMALGMQGQLWTQAMQGYGTLGQMIQTTGQLYGIDVSGYSAILQAHVQQNQIAAQVAEANAQLQAQAAQSMGSGLGSIFGSMFGGGGSGGGIFGSGGLGGVFSGIGSLFSGAGMAAPLGASAAAGTISELAPLVAGLAF